MAPEADAARGAPARVARFATELRAEARHELDRIATRLRQDGISVSSEVRDGQPAQEIARAADDTGADLIVLASHGRGGIRRWAIGSVAAEVLRLAATPVLLIPAKMKAGGSAEARATALMA
jgi:nucleotide-binding universal stress UspA family protein